jgi:hypothetical protein
MSLTNESYKIRDKHSLIPSLLPEGEGHVLPSPSGRGIEGEGKQHEHFKTVIHSVKLNSREET